MQPAVQWVLGDADSRAYLHFFIKGCRVLSGLVGR
jgi:hypothetical protein